MKQPSAWPRWLQCCQADRVGYLRSCEKARPAPKTIIAPKNSIIARPILPSLGADFPRYFGVDLQTLGPRVEFE